MGDAAPIVRRGEILLAGELLAGEHVPQPELGLQPAVGLPRRPRRSTNACALIARQSGNRGTLSMLVIFSMKAAGSIGANSPLRCRLAVMICGDADAVSSSRRRRRQEFR